MGDHVGRLLRIKPITLEMVRLGYQFDNGLHAFLQSRANDVNGLGSFDLVKY